MTIEGDDTSVKQQTNKQKNLQKANQVIFKLQNDLGVTLDWWSEKKNKGHCVNSMTAVVVKFCCSNHDGLQQHLGSHMTTTTNQRAASRTSERETQLSTHSTHRAFEVFKVFDWKRL